MADNTVIRETPAISHLRAVELSAEGVRLAQKRLGKDALAKACDSSIRVIEKWMAEGSMPDADRMLNMARVAPEVMTPLLAEMGFAPLTKSRADAANDFDLIQGLLAAGTEFVARIADGRRCHVDTAVLADLFRPIMPMMQAVVDEDNRRKGIRPSSRDD